MAGIPPRPTTAQPRPLAATALSPQHEKRPASAFVAANRKPNSDSGNLSGTFKHSLEQIEAAATAEMQRRFRSGLHGRASSAPQRRSEIEGRHEPLTAALMETERSRPTTAVHRSTASPALDTSRPMSATSQFSTTSEKSAIRGSIASGLRRRGSDVTPATPSYEGTALAALDAVFTNSSLGLKLEDAKQDIYDVMMETEGHPCSDPQERFQLFVHRLFDSPALKEHQSLTTFVQSIMTECRRYISHLERRTDIGEATLSKRAMVELARELNACKKELEDAKEKTDDLEKTVNDLRLANERHEETKTALESYIDELRCALATYANTSVLTDQVVTPDQSGVRPYVDAIRRMSMEIENLRYENMRLSDTGIQQIESFNDQSKEYATLLDRANEFQQQAGSLKATVRVMKHYVDKMELRLRFLETAESDRKHLEMGKRVTSVATLHDRGIQPDLGCLSLHAAMQWKKIAYTRPLTDQNSIAPEEAPPLQVAADDTVPEHVRFPDANAAVHSKMKNRYINTTEIQMFVDESLSQFKVANHGSCEGALKDFPQFLIDYGMKRYGNDRTRMEHCLNIHALLCGPYFARSAAFQWFALLSSGDAPAGSIDGVPLILERIRSKLQKEPATSKKVKDKIPRERFIAVLHEMLPLSAPKDIESVALSTIVSQEKYNDDITYEQFFAPETPGAQAVNDQLTLLIIANSRVMQRRISQRIYAGLKSAFDADDAQRRRLLAETGVTGTGSEGTHAHAIMDVPGPEADDSAFFVTIDQVEACIRAEDPLCRKKDMINRLIAASDCSTAWQWYNEPGSEEAEAKIEAMKAASHPADAVIRRLKYRCLFLKALPLEDSEVDVFPPLPEPVEPVVEEELPPKPDRRRSSSPSGPRRASSAAPQRRSSQSPASRRSSTK